MGSLRKVKHEATVIVVVSVLVFLISYLIDQENPLTFILALLMVVFVLSWELHRFLLAALKTDQAVIATAVIIFGCSIALVLNIIGPENLGWTFSELTAALVVPTIAILEVGTLLAPPKGSNEPIPISVAINWLSREFGALDLWKKVAAVLLCAAMLIVSMGVGMELSKDHREKFTEFYVLNENGELGDYPNKITWGENVTLNIGIVNHERRTVEYTVEVWLVEYTFINMEVNVTRMFCASAFNLTLGSVDYDLNDDWEPQYTQQLKLSPAFPGNYTLFIMLIKDGEVAVPESQPIDPTIDLARTEASWKVVLCINDSLTYLKLELTVLP